MSTPRILLSAFVACAVFLSTAYSNSGTSATLSAAQGAAKVANPITGEGLPNPAPKVTRNWGQLPAGRKWGTSAGVDIDPIDGNVWAYERCGAGTAGGAAAPGSRATPTSSIPIFKFDRNTGAVLANFGKGVMVTPHGIHVDRAGQRVDCGLRGQRGRAPRGTRSTSSARRARSCSASASPASRATPTASSISPTTSSSGPTAASTSPTGTTARG